MLNWLFLLLLLFSWESQSSSTIISWSVKDTHFNYSTDINKPSTLGEPQTLKHLNFFCCWSNYSFLLLILWCLFYSFFFCITCKTLWRTECFEMLLKYNLTRPLFQCVSRFSLPVSWRINSWRRFLVMLKLQMSWSERWIFWKNLSCPLYAWPRQRHLVASLRFQCQQGECPSRPQ